MPDSTPRLGLPWLMPAQARKHVTVNEALGRLDAITAAAVLSRQESQQPAAPEEGAAYILPEAAAGTDWSDFFAGDLAYFQDGAWARIAPRAGLTAFVVDEGVLAMFDGAVWRPFTDAISALDNLQSLGVGTAPDAANPFAAKLNAALWTARFGAEGGTGDLRFTLNKENAAATASLLFQSGWSGRAELGLAGGDDLAIKVSPDGALWHEALSVRRADGQVLIGALAALNGGPLGGFRNALLNGDFAINQRAFAGGPLSAGAYGHDRWKAAPGGAAYSMAGGVVSISAGGLTQVLEAPGLAGAALTVSVEDPSADLGVELAAANGGSGSVSGVIAAGAGRRGVTLTCPPGATADLALTLSGAASFRRAQLETGPAATPFERRPPGLERQLCQRYFQVAGYAYGQVLNDNLVSLQAPLAPAMRATPQLSITGAALNIRVAGAFNAQSAMPSLSDVVAFRDRFVCLAGGFSGLTAHDAVFALSDAWLHLDAEL